MIIGRKISLCKTLILTSINLGGINLEAVHKFGYLGVTIDDILFLKPWLILCTERRPFNSELFY